MARKHGIPLKLANALIGQESGGRTDAVSPAGATGLTQVMPSTAAGMYGISEAEARRRLKNPRFALDAGFRYLAAQKKTFGTWRKSLAAYNAGPNAVREYGGIPPYQETQAYVRSIMGKVGTLQDRPDTPAAPAATPESPAAPVVPGFDPSAFALETSTLQALGRQPKPTETLAALATAMQAAPKMPVEAPGSPPNAQPGVHRPPALGVEIQGRPTKRAAEAVSLAKRYLGDPYVWGGETPGSFDCSGLLQYVWGKKGVSIPRVTYDQWNTGRRVGKANLKPGDAVFFNKGPRGPEHVGMYIGQGKFIEAPRTGLNVRISKLSGRSDYMGARRFTAPRKKG